MNFNWNDKSVLVTGGAGLIGSHLVDALVERGAKVRVLDSLDEQTHPCGAPDWINPEAEFIHGDVRDEAVLLKALDGVEYVSHQAAFGGFTPELSKYIECNAAGIASLYEVLHRNALPVRKVVAASSQAVYGEGAYECDTEGCKGNGRQYPRSLRDPDDLREGIWEPFCRDCRESLLPVNVPEDKPLYTETIYGISKLAEEKLVLGLGRKLGIPSVALRYAVTYGPRQSVFNPYTGVVSIFSTQLLNGKSPVVFEDGNQTRDFLYVSDNVAANLLCLESQEADGRVFNVGTGRPVTVNQLVRELARIYESNLEPLLTGECRPGDVRHFVQDASAIGELGFVPQVSLEKGLECYARWILSLGDVGEHFSKARAVMEQTALVIKTKES